jgi:hypothetical protein
MITSMDTDDDKDASFSLTESDCPSPALDAAVQVTPAVVAIVVDLPSTCTLGAETLSSLLSSLSLKTGDTTTLATVSGYSGYCTSVADKFCDGGEKDARYPCYVTTVESLRERDLPSTVRNGRHQVLRKSKSSEGCFNFCIINKSQARQPSQSAVNKKYRSLKEFIETHSRTCATNREKCRRVVRDIQYVRCVRK